MPKPPPAETVTITIDGHDVQALKGEMIIAAAERAGVYIPRFCYHPRMKPVGMCRMCLIELDGPRGPALTPACFVPVADGQKISTTSPGVKKVQDGVLEYLLINHPLDCPVCDKGGECPLQDQTLSYGPAETRMVEEKRHWEKPINLSELVLLDRERCIQCARCTRFAAEVAGDPQIDFQSRADKVEVNIFPGQPFTSYFSGNTVQICPVGALTASPYRFRARPWDIEQVESTCTSCSVGCRVAVQSSSNRLTRYLGLDSEPVNHGWLCDKGRFDFEAVNDALRIAHPLVRKNGELVEASWGEALDAAAKGLREARELHGPDSVAVLGGARLANEDAYAWAKLAKGVLGTDNVDCQLGDGLPAEAVLGLPRATIDDACHADAIILLGPDLKEELPILYLRLREAVVDHGLKVVEVTPRLSGFTPYAAVTLPHLAGETAAVVSSLIGQTTPGDAVGGVPAGYLARAREMLAGAEDIVVVLGRQSLADSADHTAAAASAIHEADAGIRFLPALRRANVMGALDMGLAPGLLPGSVTLEDGREWYTAAWGSVPPGRGLDALGICRQAASAKVQGMILLGADPMADLPDRELARRALTGAGFVVAVDTFLTASVAQADVVLPAAMYSERPGTTTNLEGRVTRLGQKIVPPGVAWPDWMIAVELAEALGADLGVETIEELFDEIAMLAPSHAGLTRAVLDSRGHRDGVVVPLAPHVATGSPPSSGDTGEMALQDDAPGVRPVDPMSTPGVAAAEAHAVPVTAVAMDERVAGGSDNDGDNDGSTGDGQAGAQTGRPATIERAAPAMPSPVVLSGFQTTAISPPKPDRYSLRLVSARSLYDGGTLVAHSPHLAGLAAPASVHVHPSELARLGLSSGASARVVSARTTTTMVVEVDPTVPMGAAFVSWNGAGATVVAGDLIDAASPVTDIRLETLS